MSNWSERKGQNTVYIKKWPLIPQGPLIYRCCVNNIVTQGLGYSLPRSKWELHSWVRIFFFLSFLSLVGETSITAFPQTSYNPAEGLGSQRMRRKKKILMQKKGEIDSQVMFLYLTFYCKTNIITSNRIFLSLWWVYVPNKDWFYYFIFSSSS